MKADNQTMLLIMDTFIELMQTKHFSHITVTEISKAAGINRSTFYRYYTDIYDLMQQTEKIYIDLIAEILSRINLRSVTLSDYLSFIPENEQKEFLRLKTLISKNGSVKFVSTIIPTIQTVLHRLLEKEGLLNTNEEKRVLYMAYGISGVYLIALRSNNNLVGEQLYKICGSASTAFAKESLPDV